MFGVHQQARGPAALLAPIQKLTLFFLLADLRYPQTFDRVTVDLQVAPELVRTLRDVTLRTR